MKSKASPRKDKLTPDQQRRAADHMPYALKLSRPVERRFPGHRDDVRSAALLGLVLAARSFDPGRGVKFETFCYRRIKGEMEAAISRRSGLAGWKGKTGVPSVTSFLASREDDGRVVAPGPGPGPAFEAMLSLLPDRHAEFCRSIYRDGATFESAAVRAGYSPNGGYPVHLKALAILRSRLTPANA